MPETNLRRVRGLLGASDWNRAVEAIRKLSAFTVAGAGGGVNLPTGRGLVFGEEPPTYAQITGGSNPYSWSYVARQSGGWVTLAPGGTTTDCPAYEISGATDIPSGFIVELYPGAGCDQRFHVVRMGTTTKICVRACSTVPLYGATVQIWTTGTDSMLVDSCTTDSTGCCSFSESGSYVVKIVSGGTTYPEGTRTLNGTTITISVSVNDVVCCGGYAIPYNLTLTDAVGSLSFVYYPSYYYPIWYGGHSTNLNSCSVTTPNNVCVAAAPSNGPVKVCYRMICYTGSTPTFSVQRSWSWVYQPGTFTPIWYQDPSGIAPGQPCATAPPGACGTPQTDTSSFSANPSSSSPFALSGTPVAASGNFTSDPIGGSVAISA